MQLDNFLIKTKFWTFLIFYIALILTFIFIAAMLIGLRRDNLDFVNEMKDILKQLPQDMMEV